MEGQGPWSYRKSELPKLDIAIDRGPRFAAWKIQWESYCGLSGLLNQTASIQVQALTLCMSRDTLALINALGLSEEDMKDQSKIIEALESNLNTSPPQYRLSNMIASVRNGITALLALPSSGAETSPPSYAQLYPSDAVSRDPNTSSERMLEEMEHQQFQHQSMIIEIPFLNSLKVYIY